MRYEHSAILKEITDEVELMAVVGGEGTGQWETGAIGVWVGIMEGLGYSCSFPGNFYGGSNSSCSDGGYGGASGPFGYGAGVGASSDANSGS